MLRVAGLALICLAMFSIAGGHWAVLQTIAWTQMLRDYSREASLSVAVEKTFSGEAPCSLCQSISTARQEEKKAPAASNFEKSPEKQLPTNAVFAFAPGWSLWKYPPEAGRWADALPVSPPDPVPINFVGA